MNQLKLPRIIIGAMRLGSWGAHLSKNDFNLFVNGCLDMGLTAFDHADIYGDYTSEAQFGELLKENSSLRSQLHLITKCGIKMMAENRPDHHIKSYDSSANHIISSVETSLKNLSTDYIDVLLIHRPDYLMEPDEIAKSFTELQNQGKVLHFGVSNFTPSQFELLNASFELVTNQVEISLLKRDALDDGTLDQCMRYGIQPMAWSPLKGGAMFTEMADPGVIRVTKVGDALCEKYNCELDTLLYAWLLRHPAHILPVTGSSKLERIVAAKKALDITMDREDWYRLLEAAAGNEVA
ncbi:MAG: aldo/keto reductase [Cyclobacteriaceae bacterium]|nr:aldo/keto reductase [Cyclobacteriaceae bacterium]